MTTKQTPEYMLSTIDNPFNPFTDWDAWFAYDLRNGHNSASFLARIVRTSEELSEEDQRQATEAAIDEIIRVNTTGKWLKVRNPET